MDYNKDLIVYDLETPKYCFLASFYVIEEKKYYDFFINRFENNLFELLKFLDQRKEKYYVGYNNLRFDAQVIEYIWRNYEKFSNLSSLEICEKISIFASKEIEKSNYGLFSTYNEKDLTFKQIDLPSIWHFFNENRRVSLKQLEYELRAENIENLEFELDKDFSYEEIYGENGILEYCHNDVYYTYQHLLYTIGLTDHKLYKGKDKIKDRIIVSEETGIPCLNYDDVKIGAEWNKKDYLELSGREEKDLKPKKVNHYYGKKFKQFFPQTVSYQTKELENFVKKIGETFALNQKQEFFYKFPNDLTVCIAKGGIHSNEKFRFIKPEEDEIYLQCDIGSQYPNAIRKYEVYPKHLGKEWNKMLVGKIQRRLNFKKIFKETKDPKYNSLQEMGKLSLNGGAYGRLNTKGDWQEDPSAMLQVTIGCQLEILMIIEALVLKDFNVVSANTDGFDVLFKRSRLDEFFEICTYYEKKIGNSELGNIEYTEFEWIAQTSVNDYIAKKKGEWVNGNFIPHVSKEPGDDLKQKGDFEVYKELHKNSSFTIFPLAYEKYFNEGIDPEDFIMKHDNIFDFCARSNSGSTYYHEGYENNKSFKLPKLIRYYVSKSGIHIRKIVKETSDTNANDTNVFPKEELKTICNRLPKKDYSFHLENVKREWYIQKAKEVIFSIEKGKKPSKVKVDKNQMSLF